MASKRRDPSPAPLPASLPSPDDLLTTEQVATIIGGNTTKRTLEEWRRRHVGPDYLTLTPRMVRYRRGTLDEYLKACEVQTSGRVA